MSQHLIPNDAYIKVQSDGYHGVYENEGAAPNETGKNTNRSSPKGASKPTSSMTTKKTPGIAAAPVIRAGGGKLVELLNGEGSFDW